ncbi:MAG: hypothetical protein ABJB98_06350 [Actinomycetota bacterium]
MVDLVDVPVQEVATDPPGYPPIAPARGVPVRLAAAALAIALLCLVATVLVLHRRDRVIVRTSVAIPQVTATVDASGCPSDVSCNVSADPQRGLLDAVLTGDLSRYGFSGSTVSDAATGKPFRSSVTVRLANRLVVFATAQCIPRGAAVPGRRSLPTIGPADALVVVPGPAGCSVTVGAHVPPGVDVPAALLDQIAHDPAAQLTR